MKQTSKNLLRVPAVPTTSGSDARSARLTADAASMGNRPTGSQANNSADVWV
jgi:hypothetical protein